MTAPSLWLPTWESSDEVAILDAECYANCLSADQWRRQMKKRTAVTAVAGYPNGKRIGYAHAELIANEIELLRLGVVESERRKGWGGLLVDVLGDTVPLRLHLKETNAIGLAWAKAVGFRAVKLERGGQHEADWISLVRQPRKNLWAGG